MGRSQAGGAYRAPSPFTPTLATSASADDIAALSRSVDVLPRRSPYGKAHLCGGMLVLLDMPTKRRGLYIAYTPTRAADGSDGERTPWDAMPPNSQRG